MPIPIILGGIAAISAIGGGAAAVNGAIKMKDANDTMNLAKRIHDKSVNKFKNQTKKTEEVMDRLGTFEAETLKSFERFSEVMKNIQNKPEFEAYRKNNVELPKYEEEKIREVYVGAGVLLGALSSAAVGTAGGFAAAGVTTASIVAFATASTGTAISSLSGAAATNAILAFLGGGAIAAGGGGMALGTLILGASTLGVGLLIGGAIFNLAGENLSKKADEAFHQARNAEKTVDEICEYLIDLENTAVYFNNSLSQVYDKYKEILNFLDYKVNKLNEKDWNEFSLHEKKSLENLVCLVSLLYKMCAVNLVIRSDNKEDMSSVNHKGVNEVVKDARFIMSNEF
ncbi:hypothetical protein [Peptoanaerobacter stomatis]